MALDLGQNFVSVQCLENKMTEVHLILYMHSYWQHLHGDCYTSFFAHLNQSYGPWFTPKFHFRSIFWEGMKRISPNFIYAIILTRSMSRLLHFIFAHFLPELCPLIYFKILFLLNILSTNGQILTILCITIYTDKIYVVIVSCHFLQICKRVMTLDWCQNYITILYPEKLQPFTACKALQRGYRQILWQF